MHTESSQAPIATKRVVVLRLSGDISIKAKQTRSRFTARLRENLCDAMQAHGVEYAIEREHNRIYVSTDDERAPEIVARVFGVQAVGVAVCRPWSCLDDIVRDGVELFSEAVTGRTYGVRTRRVGQRDNIPITSMAVDLALGDALFPLARGVDLTHPEVPITIEVREEVAYFYVEPERRAFGGLPLGVEDRALTLISGGFDSAVASWMLMKRGVEQDYVFFNLAGPAQVRAVIGVLTALTSRWCYGTAPKLHIVDLRPVIAQMKSVTKGRYWQIVLKRIMLRAAEHIAATKGHLALITGEALGQVSSQALATLAPIGSSIAKPILRPLVGLNKEEIIALSRIVGTHDASAGVPEFCALDGGRPATKISVGALNAMEAAVDQRLLETMVEDREIVLVSELAERAPSFEAGVDKIPEGAVPMDLRSEAGYGGWHYPGAIHLPFDVAVTNWPRLPKDRLYVFYCEVGLKSAYLAEKMHAAGFRAHYYDGGLKNLIRYAKALGIEADIVGHESSATEEIGEDER